MVFSWGSAQEKIRPPCTECTSEPKSSLVKSSAALPVPIQHRYNYLEVCSLREPFRLPSPSSKTKNNQPHGVLLLKELALPSQSYQPGQRHHCLNGAIRSLNPRAQSFLHFTLKKSRARCHERPSYARRSREQNITAEPARPLDNQAGDPQPQGLA